ncbi:MAG: outer membrane beta-barrel protein [Isosphaeraceae bacterium]|nr:outer membrane beta-barrel protein [Isosphaeraceae bacterium]
MNSFKIGLGTLVVLLAALGQSAPAQSPGMPAASSRYFSPTSGRDAAVRRVQDAAPLPAPEVIDENLALPRAERDGLGAEATTAAEEAAEASDTPNTDFLMRVLGIPEESRFHTFGWIQNSFTGNTNGRGSNAQNFGVNPNFKANQWMGNQYYIVFERLLEQNDEINFGFRIDNLFGNDWTFNHATGLFDTQNKPGRFAGYDPAQMFAEVHLPILTEGGLDVKGGRFYTLAGYEVVPATGRPLLSVPYMFAYGQPFTHFGVLTTLHVTDKINFYNGAINGWDRWINDTYKWGYMGGLSWTFNDDKTTLTTIVIAGPNQFQRFLPTSQAIQPVGTPVTPPQYSGRYNPYYAGNIRTLVTTVLTHKWNDKLTQVFETDQGAEPRVPFIGGEITRRGSQWYSVGNWFLYSFNDKLTGVWRTEWFKDTSGARTGFADNFYEITLGAIYKPQPWLWVRPEARYDWSQFTTPYSGGTRDSQLTLAFDVIVLF